MKKSSQATPNFELGGYLIFRWRPTRKQLIAIGIAMAALIGWLANHLQLLDTLIAFFRSN